MKPASKQAKSSKKIHAVPAKKVMSKEQRSQAARLAAREAWKTMRSKAYINAKKKGAKAVQTYLENRKAA